MSVVTTVFVIDLDHTTLELFIAPPPPLPAQGFVLFQLEINFANGDAELSKSVAATISTGKVHVCSLGRGVYFLATSNALKYTANKAMRTAVNGGKNPWPKPPPAAPQGTDLAANTGVYERDFTPVVNANGFALDSWIEVAPATRPTEEAAEMPVELLQLSDNDQLSEDRMESCE
ncbi:MAG: hypothetical protein HC863_01970 [Myxococcales bacterium]|nr:hypothetical protein [Myxococcales bacterium]